MRMVEDDRDRQLQHLKQELWRIRMDVLALSRVELDFNGYYRCDSRAAGEKWLRSLGEAALKKTTTTRGQGWDEQSEYAFCPLCGQGATDFYQGYRGFKFPLGLERHLIGWGNNRQCPVMDAVGALARDSWNERFREQEIKARQTEYEIGLKRHREEDVYLIDPSRDPVLLDEGSYSFQPHRSSLKDDPHSLQWAIQRLASLGLQQRSVAKRSGTGSIISFVEEYPEYAVYADPRVKGQVSFLVVKQKGGKPSSRRPRQASSLTRFEFRDRWKNDLQRKYRDAVEAALKELGIRTLSSDGAST